MNTKRSAVVKAGYTHMIVGRRENGEVEAAGWDCPATREDAKEWLGRGLTLELASAATIETIADPSGVFSTTKPVGRVWTPEQAKTILSGNYIDDSREQMCEGS